MQTTGLHTVARRLAGSRTVVHAGAAVNRIAGGTLLRGAPLAEHTSWRVGGAAERLFRPDDAAGLAQFLAQLPAGEPLLWIGLGSNLLVRDGGVRGTVILLSAMPARIEALGATGLRADAGVPCAKIARFAVQQGLTGTEFLAGIPGTLGGALAMNAGAFGSETWNIVRRVDTIDRHGKRRERGRAEFETAYRSVRLPGEEWFLGAELELAQDTQRGGAARIRELLRVRAAQQPTGVFSCGSVFKNPPREAAGRLVDHCGLKGTRIGGAEVSARHANFIVNDGNATAADIEALIELVQCRVAEQTGVRLEPEVRIVGEPA
jgi:UDP-N-acetylmuramate dehydrogenase